MFNAACRIFRENNNGKRIYHKHFDTFVTAPIINWPIPLFVVGLSRHVKDASSLLVDKKNCLWEMLRVSNLMRYTCQVYPLVYRKEHSISHPGTFSLKKKNVTKFEVNSIKLLFCFSCM